LRDQVQTVPSALTDIAFDVFATCMLRCWVAVWMIHFMPLASLSNIFLQASLQNLRDNNQARHDTSKQKTCTHSYDVLLLFCALQLVQQLPGRSSSEQPGDGHCAAVLCVAAHPSRPVLASAGHDPDCTVKIWAAGGQS
jgi:hypothetical protein